MPPHRPRLWLPPPLTPPRKGEGEAGATSSMLMVDLMRCHVVPPCGEGWGGGSSQDLQRACCYSAKCCCGRRFITPLRNDPVCDRGLAAISSGVPTPTISPPPSPPSGPRSITQFGGLDDPEVVLDNHHGVPGTSTSSCSTSRSFLPRHGSGSPVVGSSSI